jgi:predicted enzyme related to lactoylglutathione lyase
LEKAAYFYQKIMGFELSTDQKWAKIFRVAENAYIGCVDGNVGYHKPAEEKPVMLTIVVDDPDKWYKHFQDKGIKTLNEPHDDKELNLRIFLLEDPEGYVIEIQKFY